MKKLFATLCLLLFAQAASAQTFPVPPDIQTWFGASGYTAVAATYAGNGVQNVLGDGSNARGGVPPAFAHEPADIPTPNRTTWLVNGATYDRTADYCAVGVELDQFGSPCVEPKFRTHAMFSHVSFDDPIRNYGQPAAAHCHVFFGNRATNAYSTYASLRTWRSSTAAGGEDNASGYWYPCHEKVISSKTYVIKQNYNVIYYNLYDAVNSPRTQRLPRGLRYIGGTNMDDPDDSLVKKEIATANALPGNTGRYQYRNNGIVGYQCTATSDFVTALTLPNGTDAFAAQPGGTCPSGSTIIMTLGFPECWDGANLWSPGGYKHLRQVIIDNQAPGDHLICPNGWYRLPQLEILFVFSENGASDYTTWIISSDAGAQAKLNSFSQCAADYSNAPCHEGVTARTIGKGGSFHTDWFGGWDYGTMQTWQTNCLALPEFGNSQAHQCPPSDISSSQSLLYSGLPDGNIVRTTDVHSTTTISDMVPLASVQHGPMTMHNTQ